METSSIIAITESGDWFNEFEISLPLYVDSYVYANVDGSNYNYSAYFSTTISMAGYTTHSSRDVKKNISRRDFALTKKLFEVIDVQDYNHIDESETCRKHSGVIAETFLEKGLNEYVIDFGDNFKSNGFKSRYNVDYCKMKLKL